MNATLIDLHVRLGKENQAPVNIREWTDRAKTIGIDGIAVIGHDAAPQWTGESNGVVVYGGVEVDTDVGRLLCYPRDLDEWFVSGGWKSVEKTNGGGPEVYDGAKLVAAFAERGGAVVVAQPYDRDLDHPCAEDKFSAQQGLAAVVVTSSPRHTTSNERAAEAASAAKLPGVGGSASDPSGERFGAVATLFLRPPRDQAGLVDGLKKGRLWPVEISQRQPEKVDSKDASKSDDKQSGRRKRRPKNSDDRGNRLDLSMLAKQPDDNPFDVGQPDSDPIARLYGVDGRKNQALDRLAHLSDEELDRINGNRARGADNNVMMAPDFRELRAERQHVNLLLRTIERNDHDDSIALRFAFKAMAEATPEQLAEVEERHERASRSNYSKRRRRRRK